MIELLSAERCTRCNICIRVCPMDVFDLTADGPPELARRDDCQTCFMCEVHCPAEAIYVAPIATPAPAGSPHLELERLISEKVIGSYRARLGWGAGAQPPRTTAEAYTLAGVDPPDAPPLPWP